MKLQHKKVDMMIANEVGEQKGFAQDENAVTVLWDQQQRVFAEMAKNKIGTRINWINSTRGKEIIYGHNNISISPVFV